MDTGFSIRVADRFSVYVSSFFLSRFTSSFWNWFTETFNAKTGCFSIQTYAPRGEHDVIVAFHHALIIWHSAAWCRCTLIDNLQSFCRSENRRVLGLRSQSFDYGVDVSTHKIINSSNATIFASSSGQSACKILGRL
jgi:hypothetical protein